MHKCWVPQLCLGHPEVWSPEEKKMIPTPHVDWINNPLTLPHDGKDYHEEVYSEVCPGCAIKGVTVTQCFLYDSSLIETYDMPPTSYA